MSTTFLTPSCSLRQLITDINSIHAKKNEREKMFTTPIGCLVFIAASLKAINSEIIKRNGRRLPSLLTGFTKRLFTLVGLWGIDPFLTTLQLKYPASGCSYCHALPCSCGATKEKPWKQEGNIRLGADQSEWSLSEWQSHHLLVYGMKNSTLSSDRLVAWQGEEFLETFIAIGWLEYARTHSLPTHSGVEALAQELPDLFMRTLAIANHQVIDIETLLIERYRNGCAKCQERFCICPDTTGDFELFEQHTLAGTRPAKE